MVPRLTPPAAFLVVAATVATFLAASSAPSPLYPAYERAFGFSAPTLTVVFAVYVVALLAALLVAGRLSDHVGRRPVLGAALVVELAALVAFLTATDTGALVLARVVQGLATGTAMGVMGAYLLDLQRYGTQRGALVNSVAPGVGLALGGVLAGVLAQYAPAPLHLVYAVLAVLVAALLLTIPSLPETVRPTPRQRSPRSSGSSRCRPAPGGRSWQPCRSWPRPGRSAASCSRSAERCWRAGWGSPTTRSPGPVIGTFTGAGALASLLARDLPARVLTRAGLAALVTGLAGFVGALLTTSLPLLVGAVAVAGTGFGVAFLGSLRTLTSLAAPEERSGLMSAVFTVSYLAFSVPALVAGVLTTLVGLEATTLGYAVLVALVAAGALAAEGLAGRTEPEAAPVAARVPAGCGASDVG